MRLIMTALFALLAVAFANVASDYVLATVCGVIAFAVLIGVGRFARFMAGLVMIIRAMAA